MKQALIAFILVMLGGIYNHAAAQNDDIELTDSTSTDWGGGSGGGLNPGTPTGPVTTMTLSKTAATILVGKTVKLVAQVNKDAGNKAVSWTSSMPTVATVDANGLVCGMAVGTAIITASADGNEEVRQTCTITVEKIGDVNGDKAVSAQDASLIQQFVARKFTTSVAGFRAHLADVNGDGEVNAQDASLVQQYAARKISW